MGLFLYNRLFQALGKQINSYLATRVDRTFEKAKGVVHLCLIGIKLV